MPNPAVDLITLPAQQQYRSDTFPLAMQPTSEIAVEQACEWIRTQQETLGEGLSKHGAILFRGFGLTTAEDFDAFVRAFDYPNFAYAESLSNAVRVNRTDRVFTANEAPSDVRIHLHHEMAQTPIYPSRLFFFCEQPAETGGATPLSRSDELLERLREAEPQFVTDCERRGLKYTNVMPAANDATSGMGRSWQSTLRADSQADAESRLSELGYSWQWTDDGSLRVTTPVLPAVRPLTNGRTSFFNQLIAASQGWKDTRNDPSKAITHGDGTPLDINAVTTACQIADEITFDIPWQAGDVALVDNYAVMHARRPFTGTRRILASLIASSGTFA